MIKTWLTPLFLSSLSSLTVGALAETLTVEVTQVEAATGDIYLAVYREGDDFPSESTVYRQVSAAATLGTTTILITDLPAGQYAIAAFHDVDEDGGLTRNLIGMPQEPFGFSNDAPVYLGPPSFEQAAFDKGAEDLTITFGLR